MFRNTLPRTSRVVLNGVEKSQRGIASKTSSLDSQVKSEARDQQTKLDPAPKETEVKNTPAKPKKKTMAELDEELRLKLEGISGEGGGAGVEYEDGKASGLKRGVKDNMFRVI